MWSLLKITVEYYEKVETFQEQVLNLPYQQCMKYVSGNSNKIGKIFNIRKKSEIRILAFVWNWLSARIQRMDMVDNGWDQVLNGRFDQIQEDGCRMFHVKKLICNFQLKSTFSWCLPTTGYVKRLNEILWVSIIFGCTHVAKQQQIILRQNLINFFLSKAFTKWTSYHALYTKSEPKLGKFCSVKCPNWQKSRKIHLYKFFLRVPIAGYRKFSWSISYNPPTRRKRWVTRQDEVSQNEFFKTSPDVRLLDVEVFWLKGVFQIRPSW